MTKVEQEKSKAELAKQIARLFVMQALSTSSEDISPKGNKHKATRPESAKS